MKKVLFGHIMEPPAHDCTYSLQVILPICLVGVEHEVANERASFEDTVEIIQVDASVLGNYWRVPEKSAIKGQPLIKSFVVK